MSYILDALKKADSERERGAVPGIHAQQVPHMAVAARPAGNLKLVLWLIVGLLTILVGALAWRMSTGDAPPVQVAAVPISPVAAPATPAAPVKAIAPAAPEPVPSPAAPAAPEVKPVAKEKAPAPKLAASKADSKVAAKAVPAKAGASAAAKAADEPRVYLMSELPDDVQRDLPKLSISGGTYSSNAAQRLLIVNNQVFLEGSHPAPDVTVEQIRPNAAVLSFRGYRYRITY